MSPYKIHLLSPQETESFLSKKVPSHLGRVTPEAHKKVLLPDGFELRGEFELIARDGKSGEVEWRHAQENLITDLGKQAFWDFGWTNIRLGFAPSTEIPSIFRCSLGTDGSQTFISSNLGSGTVTPSTYTKQWSTTFGLPGSNRTLGILYTAYFSSWGPSAAVSDTNPDGNLGPVSMLSYSLLTPPKTQTTTQTLEVVYKLSMNPIY